MGFELLVCVNRRYGPKPSCAGRGSEALVEALTQGVLARRLPITISRTVCQNACERGPTLRLLPGPVLFYGIGPDDVAGLLDRIEAHTGGPAGPGLPPPI